MPQNLISLDLSDDLPKFDAALDAIEGILDVFVSLTPEQTPCVKIVAASIESTTRGR